ncbi:MAG: hypothetical protein LIO95_10790 [Clostridiales bacterium]|nr:hypothetical protein [Clostridiales bacterium]
MSYYVVKKAVAARDFPSSDTGKQVVKLTAGQVVQADDCGSFSNTALGKVYLPVLVDGAYRWVHDAYLIAISNRQAAALLHGESWLGKKPGSKAIAWYNSTDSGKSDPKPTSEAYCTVGALWGISQGTDLGSLISRTAAKLEKKARSKGIWHAKGSSYSPKPGDLVLFKSTGKSSATHTELLASKSGDTLNTINYNDSGVCKRKSRKTTDDYTYGYVEMSY